MPRYLRLSLARKRLDLILFRAFPQFAVDMLSRPDQAPYSVVASVQKFRGHICMQSYFLN